MKRARRNGVWMIAAGASVVICAMTGAASSEYEPDTGADTAGAAVNRAARSAIQSALDAMTKSVLAADVDGYLAHVDQADGVFFKEQQNWAADLLRHKPEVFDLSIGDALDVNGDHATFTLTMKWRMPGAADRTVTMPVSFASDQGRWRYRGEQLASLAPPADPASGFYGVRVDFDPELKASAEQVVEVMPAIRRRVDRLFGVKVQREQRVKLYSTMAHLQASIYLSYDHSLSGWNEPGESIKLLVNPSRPPSRLRLTLAHEYGHCATFEYGALVTDAPWWSLEGVAEVASGAVASAPLNDATMLDWVIAGNIAPWPKIADFRNTDDRWRSHVYRQGRSMVDFITRAFGDEGRNALFGVLATGATIERASEQALGEPWDSVDRRWHYWLMQRAMARHADKLESPGKPPASVRTDTLRLVELDAP